MGATRYIHPKGAYQRMPRTMRRVRKFMRKGLQINRVKKAFKHIQKRFHTKKNQHEQVGFAHQKRKTLNTIGVAGQKVALRWGAGAAAGTGGFLYATRTKDSKKRRSRR